MTEMESKTEIDRILERVRLNRGNLTSTIVQEIFSNLTVKEISSLCITSRQFEAACKQESLWRNKVRTDYGISKIYGPTWRETAKLLSKHDMINLNDKWVDNRTYREIFDLFLIPSQIFEDGYELYPEMRSVQKQRLLDILDDEIENDILVVPYDEIEDEIQKVSDRFLGWNMPGITDELIGEIYLVASKEMKIIEAASIAYRNVPLGDMIGFVDPILFLINFSRYSYDELIEDLYNQETGNFMFFTEY